MPLIFYGSHSVPLGVEELSLKCPCCEQHSPADVMVSSKYFHIYGLPIGPVDKPAIIICKECGLKRQSYFDKNLIADCKEIKNRFRHPWFVYTGVGLACTFILSVLSAIVFG